jgi:hypothetical protein
LTDWSGLSPTEKLPYMGFTIERDRMEGDRAPSGEKGC